MIVVCFIHIFNLDSNSMLRYIFLCVLHHNAVLDTNLIIYGGFGIHPVCLLDGACSGLLFQYKDYKSRISFGVQRKFLCDSLQIK